MRSYYHLLMPILRGRDHLDRRLAGLFPWHTSFILLDVFQSEFTEEANVALLRDAASAAPSGVQRVLPVGPDHAILLFAAVPTTTRSAVEYAVRVTGDRNFVVHENGEARDRDGVIIAGSKLDADAIDLWAAHLGVTLYAEGLFERTPSFLAYARAVSLP